MAMTTTVTLRYEGPSSCRDCQRGGVPVCAHIGFNPEAWDHLVGQGVHVPGLDDNYEHVLTALHIAEDRKTIALTVSTSRPRLHDLARHLSTYSEVRGKAAVRAVHHETGAVLEEGHYDRHLATGMSVAIDRQLYHVARVEHPNRDPDTGIAADGDLQIAHLVPIPADEIRAST